MRRRGRSDRELQERLDKVLRTEEKSLEELRQYLRQMAEYLKDDPAWQNPAPPEEEQAEDRKSPEKQQVAAALKYSSDEDDSEKVVVTKKRLITNMDGFITPLDSDDDSDNEDSNSVSKVVPAVVDAVKNGDELVVSHNEVDNVTTTSGGSVPANVNLGSTVTFGNSDKLVVIAKEKEANGDNDGDDGNADITNKDGETKDRACGDKVAVGTDNSATDNKAEEGYDAVAGTSSGTGNGTRGCGDANDAADAADECEGALGIGPPGNETEQDCPSDNASVKDGDDGDDDCDADKRLDDKSVVDKPVDDKRVVKYQYDCYLNYESDSELPELHFVDVDSDEDPNYCEANDAYKAYNAFNYKDNDK